MLNKRTRALGRLPSGEMNKTEKAYADVLKDRQLNGEIAWWGFEVMKFKLADKCFYSPDFSVMLANGEIEQHEVKGSPRIFQDDAKVKIKVAAAQLPFRFVVCYPNAKKDGGGFRTEEV